LTLLTKTFFVKKIFFASSVPPLPSTQLERKVFGRAKVKAKEKLKKFLIKRQLDEKSTTGLAYVHIKQESI
jgi:hypothetical protein